MDTKSNGREPQRDNSRASATDKYRRGVGDVAPCVAACVKDGRDPTKAERTNLKDVGFVLESVLRQDRERDDMQHMTAIVPIAKDTTSTKAHTMRSNTHALLEVPGIKSNILK